VGEAIPEDGLAGFGGEGGGTVTAARGDEVDSVVAVPMLEAMLGAEKFLAIVGTLSEHAEELSQLSPISQPGWRLKPPPQ